MVTGVTSIQAKSLNGNRLAARLANVSQTETVQPGLQALLLCDDEKVVRVLRRVLSELEIGVEHCLDPDTAVQKITRQRFEAVVVDCTNHDVASRVLKATRSAPANKRAVVVAIVDSQSSLNGTFALGAHFVLYKPIALE